MTISHDALDLTIQGPPADMGHGIPLAHPLVVTSRGHQLRTVQTCSLDLTVQIHYWY